MLRKLLAICLITVSISCFAQKELNFSAVVNYAPNNYTTGSGFFTAEEKIQSISQTPVLMIGFNYLSYKTEKLSLGVGLEYSYVRAQSSDYTLAGISGTPDQIVSSNDVTVRNYLLPNVSATFHSKISRKKKLLFSLRAKLGVPFLSYDRIEMQGFDPIFGIVTGESEKISKYSGDDLGGSFSDGLMYGGEFSCLYSFFARKNKSIAKIQIGPNLNLFKLQSASDIKFSAGLKFVYAYNLSKR